jgi:thiol-disulfide isomerase/thioredoxin
MGVPGRVRLILSATVAVALLALAGCGTAEQGRPRPAGQAASRGGTAAPAVPAKLAFTATTLDGKAFDGASLAGHPVVLWFWAPWCAACAGEAQTLTDLAPGYAGKVDFVGVAGMGSEDEMRQFVAEGRVASFPHLSDNAGLVWKRFGVTEQSIYVLLDRGGAVVKKGWLDDQQITAEVAKLAAA